MFKNSFLILLVSSHLLAIDPEFERQVEEALTQYHVPGMAIVVMQSGKTVYEKGFGYRDISKKLPMTPNTLGNVCSINKSLSAAAVAILMDRKKLDWTQPLKKYLPDLKLSTTELTDSVTVQDVLSHRTGIPRHDFFWEVPGFTNEEIYQRFKFLPSSKPLRAEWQYSNLTYMVLIDRLIEKVSGVKYPEFVRKNIFKPLGFKRSTLFQATRNADSDSAKPYYWEKDKFIEVEDGVYDRYGAAGAWNTSAQELAQWGGFQLGNGNGVLSEKLLKELQSPQMKRSKLGLKLGEGIVGHYGFGWNVYDFPNSARWVFHTGGATGFSSHLDFMPATKTVVAIVTNQDIESFSVATFLALELHRKLDALPVKALKPLIQDNFEEEKKESIKVVPDENLKSYVGNYEHHAYGKVLITLSKSH